MAAITLTQVNKKFKKNWVVRDLTLNVHDKEFIVLVGPSGCGKSTTLRMIAGLEEVTSGEIAIDGRVVNDIPPKDRDIAMVFQSYALYPHMSVFENMAFGLRNRKFSKAEIEQRVTAAAEILGISELLHRKPRQLSGGQRQRVAMGRAIVRDPRAFLFDEPLSNLDAKLRVQMRAELSKLHQRLETTIVYVTHDQIEAMTLADRIVIMNDGRIMQEGRPLEVYENPKNLFVAGFIGSPSMNFLDVRLVDVEGQLMLDGDTFQFPVPSGIAERYRSHVNQDLILGIRPEHVTDFSSVQGQPGIEKIHTIVNVIEPLGSEIVLIIATGKHQLTARVKPSLSTRVNDTIVLGINMNKIHLFDKQTGMAIGFPNSKP